MFKSVLAATALAGFTFSAHAVTVAQWDFETSTVPVAGTSFTGVLGSTGGSTAIASGSHATSATYSAPAGNGSSKSLSSNTWAVGDYWQFAFSTVGFSGLTISFDQTGSNTGPKDFSIAYSANGTSFTTLANSNYSLSAVTWSSGTAVTTSTFTFDLSSLTALNNNVNVAIRLVDTSTVSINGGVVASGGTDRVDNFTVAASPVPEAGTPAMLAAGLAVLGFLAVRRKA